MKKGRVFVNKPANKGYNNPPGAQVDKDLYSRLSNSASANVVKTMTVPKKSGLAWEMLAGQTCRFVLAYGSQVVDVNIWNLHDTTERFYSGKTKQIHHGHVTTYDRLWSNIPYVRPLATITQDSLEDYGIDDEGCSVHDVMGTRCDPYTMRLILGRDPGNSCHQNLVDAVKPFGLNELDVHDSFTPFMASKWDRNTDEYILRGSPAETGDYLEILVEMDVLVALSTCPHADCSIPVGEYVPDSMCFPVDVIIGQPSQVLLDEWKNVKIKI